MQAGVVLRYNADHGCFCRLAKRRTCTSGWPRPHQDLLSNSMLPTVRASLCSLGSHSPTDSCNPLQLVMVKGMTAKFWFALMKNLHQDIYSTFNAGQLPGL